nr:ribosomal protein L22 [Medicago sativa subsp. falcata]
MLYGVEHIILFFFLNCFILQEKMLVTIYISTN